MASLTDLVQALEASYAGTADDATRKQCEFYLLNTDGLMPFLLEILQTPDADLSLKLAACIKLKNMVTSRWTVSAYRADVCKGMDRVALTDAEKEMFCMASYPLLRSVVAHKALRKLVVLCIRTAIDNDYTHGEYLKILCDQMEASLQAGQGHAEILSALEPLRIIFDFNRDSANDITEAVLVKFYPVLLGWCGELASSPFFASEESSAVVRLLVKVLGAILKLTVPTNTEAKSVLCAGYLQTIEFLLAVCGQPIPNLADYDSDERNTLFSMKAVKNAVTILNTTQFYKYMGKPQLAQPTIDPRKELLLNSGIMEKIINTLLMLLQHSHQYDEKVGIQIMSAFCSSIEQAYVYGILKPHMGGLITEVCQRWMAYDSEDVEKWEEDPVEVAKADIDSYWGMDQSDSALRFISQLCRFRSKDWLEFILNHITNVLETAATTPKAERMKTVGSADGVDAKKDGALCMLGCISQRLRHRKLPMDNVFLTHVAPECSSVNPFLRKRACWVVHEFLNVDMGGKNEEICMTEDTLITLYRGVHSLMSDQEIPVRSQAAVAVRVFFGICSEQCTYQALKAAIESDFRTVVASLFSLTNEEGLLDNERIIESITELMHNFKEAALPYVAEIMQQLVQKLDTYMEEGEDQDVMYGSKWQTAMQIVETITTILDSLERSGNQAVFSQVEPVLAPLLYKMIGPMCDFDLMEDGLSLLGNLTFAIPQFSQTTWALFTLIYTSLVGGPAPADMTFPTEAYNEEGQLDEWGSIAFKQIISVIDNFICLDTKEFVNGSARFSDGSMVSYLDMLLRIAQVYLVPDVEDYDDKALHTLELMALCFEGFCHLDKNNTEGQTRVRSFGVNVLRNAQQFIHQIKMIEDDLAKKMDTHLSCMIRLWSVMSIWDTNTFLEMIAEVGIQQEVMMVLYAPGRQTGDKVIYNNGLEGPRTVCLGSCAALVHIQSNDVLKPYVQGIVETLVNSFRAQMTHLSNNMVDDEWGCFDDSEQELDETEDAKITNSDRIMQSLRAQLFENEDLYEDDSFEPSTELCVRKSPVTEMDEFQILEQTLTNGEMIFKEILGADGLNLFKEEVRKGYMLHEEWKKREEDTYC